MLSYLHYAYAVASTQCGQIFWSKPVLLNWRQAVQWSLPHWSTLFRGRINVCRKNVGVPLGRECFNPSSALFQSFGQLWYIEKAKTDKWGRGRPIFKRKMGSKLNDSVMFSFFSADSRRRRKKQKQWKTFMTRSSASSFIWNSKQNKLWLILA